MKIKKNIAIITARGGSKRIPHKNIKHFMGQPIIKYSIDAAKNAGCFDEVMVSTDDPEIAEISKSFGASVPFMRSSATSDDYSTTAEVVLEVLDAYKKEGVQFNNFCCIYPTAPFVTAEKLKNGLDILAREQADSVVPVVRFSYPIQRALAIDDNRLSMMLPENLTVRSQDLKPAFHDVGQFYIMKIDKFYEYKTILTTNTAPMEISELEMQDIDNEEDWKIAEVKYNFLQQD